MRVEEVMSTKIETISSEETVETAAKIMVDKHIGALIILEYEELKGIITERDILKIIANHKSVKTKIKEVMSKKLITINYDAILEEAADLMVQYKIKKLPVLKDGKLVGIVTATDLITYEKNLVEKLSEIFLFSSKRPFMAG